MNTNPKKNRTCIDHVLIEQFLRKGYRCEKVEEQNATVFIITHEKRNADLVIQTVNETYKDLLRSN